MKFFTQKNICCVDDDGNALEVFKLLRTPVKRNFKTMLLITFIIQCIPEILLKKITINASPYNGG